MTVIPADIRAIAFDAVGTLIHPDPPAPVVYAQVGRHHGSRLTAEAIAPRFATAFAREEELDRVAGFRTSENREIERWRRIVASVLNDVNDGSACFQELFDHFSRPESWRLEEEAATTLAELHRRGYVLALASNYDRRLRQVMAGMPALQVVRHLVISSEVGWRKPAGEFFSALRQTLGYPARQVLLVGDDRVNDYEGGQTAGLQVILLNTGNQDCNRLIVGMNRLGQLYSP